MYSCGIGNTGTGLMSAKLMSSVGLLRWINIMCTCLFYEWLPAVRSQSQQMIRYLVWLIPIKWVTSNWDAPLTISHGKACFQQFDLWMQTRIYHVEMSTECRKKFQFRQSLPRSFTLRHLKWFRRLWGLLNTNVVAYQESVVSTFWHSSRQHRELHCTKKIAQYPDPWMLC